MSLLKMRSDDQRRARLEVYQRTIKNRVARGSDHWKLHVNKDKPTFEDWITVLGYYQIKHGRFTSNDVYQALRDPVGPPVFPYVENNRWIARCECGGMEGVDPEDPRFYCWTCLNYLQEGRARVANFPQPWQAYEAALAARPDPLNRCIAFAIDDKGRCRPTQKLKDLQDENEQMGIPRELKAYGME